VPGLKSEMLEWYEPIWYSRFVNEVAPRVRVSLALSVCYNWDIAKSHRFLSNFSQLNMNLDGKASKKASLFLTGLLVCSPIPRSSTQGFCLVEVTISSSAKTPLFCKRPGKVLSIIW
jgi:hypothetical protein